MMNVCSNVIGDLGSSRYYVIAELGSNYDYSTTKRGMNTVFTAKATESAIRVSGTKRASYGPTEFAPLFWLDVTCTRQRSTYHVGVRVGVGRRGLGSHYVTVYMSRLTTEGGQGN